MVDGSGKGMVADVIMAPAITSYAVVPVLEAGIRRAVPSEHLSSPSSRAVISRRVVTLLTTAIRYVSQEIGLLTAIPQAWDRALFSTVTVSNTPGSGVRDGHAVTRRAPMVMVPWAGGTTSMVAL